MHSTCVSIVDLQFPYRVTGDKTVRVGAVVQEQDLGHPEERVGCYAQDGQRQRHHGLSLGHGAFSGNIYI